MNIVVVVSPRNAKHNHPFRLDDALKDLDSRITPDRGTRFLIVEVVDDIRPVITWESMDK